MKRVRDSILVNVQKWADDIQEAADMLPVGHAVRSKLLHISHNILMAKVMLERLLLSETKL